MSKSKQIGTVGENAVVAFLCKNGWPHAERRILNGIHDKGDVTGTPGLAWEIKAGKAAENAGDGQIRNWLADTERERLCAKADIGILVVKRRGYGSTRAGEWWAVLDAGVFADLVYEPEENAYSEFLGFPVRGLLRDVVELLHDSGYGDANG